MMVDGGRHFPQPAGFQPPTLFGSQNGSYGSPASSFPASQGYQGGNSFQAPLAQLGQQQSLLQPPLDTMFGQQRPRIGRPGPEAGGTPPGWRPSGVVGRRSDEFEGGNVESSRGCDGSPAVRGTNIFDIPGSPLNMRSHQAPGIDLSVGSAYREDRRFASPSTSFNDNPNSPNRLFFTGNSHQGYYDEPAPPPRVDPTEAPHKGGASNEPHHGQIYEAPYGAGQTQGSYPTGLANGPRPTGPQNGRHAWNLHGGEELSFESLQFNFNAMWHHVQHSLETASTMWCVTRDSSSPRGDPRLNAAFAYEPLKTETTEPHNNSSEAVVSLVGVRPRGSFSATTSSSTSWVVRTEPALQSHEEEAGAPSAISGFLPTDAAVWNKANDCPIPAKELRQFVLSNHFSVWSLKGNKANSANQDRALAAGVAGGLAQLFAVFDGHGECGHTVAEASAELVPTLLLRRLAEGGAIPAPPPHEDAVAFDLWQRWPATACRVFEEVHSMLETATARLVSRSREQDLPAHLRCDARASGTTATVALYLPGRAVMLAHVGDSRAVLGTRPRRAQIHASALWRAVALTRDHKPDMPDERARIESCGAQVLSSGPEGKTKRVFTPQQSWPSINMSRSLGDLHAHTQGLSATAEVGATDQVWRSADDEAFLILASDGVWDVLSDQAAVDLTIASATAGEDPATALAQEAYRLWLQRGLQGNYVDDITVIVKFLS